MRTILAMIAVLGMATVAQAAMVNLSITAGGGEWEVRASVVGGSEGICDFGVDIVGSGGITVDSSLNVAPEGLDPSAYQWWGLTDMRSDGTAGVGIVASQKAIYSGGNDPAQDALVVQGLGQDAGSRDCLVNGTISWDADILLASGTYTGSVGTLTVTGIGWNLLSTVGSWQGPGNLEAPTAVNSDSIFVPEPATLTLLVLGSAGLVVRYRRAALFQRERKVR